LTSDPRHHDLIKLNALVDGELPPDERAALAGRLANERDLARAYATLARLKATVGEVADAPAFELPPRRKTQRARWIAAGAALAAALAVGVFLSMPRPADTEGPLAEGPTAITLASLPAGTTVPRLDTAGLKLTGLVIDPGNVPLVSATYRGPHGCRLDLRAWPVDARPPAATGAESRRWSAGNLVYELTAHGMPASRFALIAGAAEGQTAANADHDRIGRQLREAGHGAPPCAG
jgi:anti-sigma factor RsiW